MTHSAISYVPPLPNGRAPVTLTVQELQAAYLAQYDLGPGYPQLEVADYIRQLYMDDTIEDLSLRFAPLWSPDKQSLVDSDLDAAVRAFLHIPRGVGGLIRVTFSGSIALDRVLAAALRMTTRTGADTLNVVTTTPCIDIMRLFLEERRAIIPHFVESKRGGLLGRLDLDPIIETVRGLRRGGGSAAVAVLLSSPENPTGATWTTDELRILAAACAELGAFLILDHCFAVAGVHDSTRLARIWDLDMDALPCEWVAVWDTGKTFGLNEDKLGFILSGTERVQTAVDESIAVLQFGVARRQKMFFSELLRRAFFYGHIDDLRQMCRSNLATATECAGDKFSVRPITAGSLLLLDITPLGLTDEELRGKLLKHGIGVVAGNVFFHTDDWRPQCFVRVALARRPEYFAEAMSRLLSVLP